MRILAVLVAAMAIGCQTAPVATPEAPTEPRAEPEADPPPVDYTALRTQYGDRPDFSVLCEQEHPLRDFFTLANAEQWDELLATSQSWLAKCPVDIDARLFSAIALTKLGQPDRAREQIAWRDGLVESILASGDGRSAQTAFVVISVPEEYALLRALGLESRGQKLLDGRIDELTVEDPESRRASMYFNPAAHFRRLDRALGIAP